MGLHLYSCLGSTNVGGVLPLHAKVVLGGCLPLRRGILGFGSFSETAPSPMTEMLYQPVFGVQAGREWEKVLFTWPSGFLFSGPDVFFSPGVLWPLILTQEPDGLVCTHTLQRFLHTGSCCWNPFTLQTGFLSGLCLHYGLFFALTYSGMQADSRQQNLLMLSSQHLFLALTLQGMVALSKRSCWSLFFSS